VFDLLINAEVIVDDVAARGRSASRSTICKPGGDDLRRRGTSFERRSHPKDGATLLVDTGSLHVPGLFEFAQI